MILFRYGKVVDSECPQTCGGDACGGQWRNSVYYVPRKYLVFDLLYLKNCN